MSSEVKEVDQEGIELSQEAVNAVAGVESVRSIVMATQRWTQATGNPVFIGVMSIPGRDGAEVSIQLAEGTTPEQVESLTGLLRSVEKVVALQTAYREMESLPADRRTWDGLREAADQAARDVFAESPETTGKQQ